MRAWVLLFAAQLGACVETQPSEVPATSELLFLVRVDAENRPIAVPEGPYRGTGALLGARTVSGTDAILAVSIAEEAIRERFPAYAAREAGELRAILTPAGLLECDEYGQLEEERRLVVPLEQLEQALSVRPLSGSSDARAWPLPAGLALRFEARVCQRGPTVRLRPFGAAERALPTSIRTGFKQIFNIVVLDEDTLVLVGFHALVRVRRGQLVDPVADVFPLGDTLAVPGPDLEWELRFGALKPAGVPPAGVELIAVATLRSSKNDVEDPDVGAAVVRVAIPEQGPFELRAATILSGEPPSSPSGLDHVHVESDGRYVAVGTQTVVTATTWSTPPRRSSVAGFEGLWIFPLNAPGAPHLVVGGGSQVFEGDLFDGLAPSSIATAPGTGRLRLTSATRWRGPGGPIIVSAYDGHLFERRSSTEWPPFAFDVPQAARGCAVTEQRCGRTKLGRDVNQVLYVPGHGGLLVGSRFCTGLFWRSELDSCASVVPVNGEHIERMEQLGVRAIIEHHGRVFVGAGIDSVYEVEFVDETPEPTL